MYQVYVVPITLYWDSDSALARNPYRSGVLNETGSFQILNERTVNGVRVIGLGRNGVAIGWIREEDNLVASTLTLTSGTMYTTTTANFTINRTAGVTNTTHKLIVRLNGKQLKVYNNLTTSVNVNYTIQERSKIYRETPRDTSANMGFVLETYLNGKLVQPVRTYSMLVHIPESIKPQYTEKPRLQTRNSYNGQVYANRTTLIVNHGQWIPGEGAELVSVQSNIEGEISNTDKQEFIPRRGGRNYYTVTATDSRGRKTTYNSAVDVVPYNVPTVSLFSVARLKSNPSIVAINLSGKVFDGQSTPPRVTIIYNEVGQTWTTRQVVAVNRRGEDYWVDTTISNINSDKIYDFQAEIIDNATGIYNVKTTLGTEDIPLSLGSHGAGVGVYFDETTGVDLQVGDGGISTEGDIILKGISLSKSYTVARLKDGDDLNKITQTGFYKLENNHANAPAQIYWGNLIVMNGGEQWGSDTLAQIAVSIGFKPEMFFRVGLYNGQSWTPWQKVTSQPV